MYRLELHCFPFVDDDRIVLCSFVQAQSCFSTLQAVEERLAVLVEDINSSWGAAFATTKEGVVAIWERNSANARTGSSTDLCLMVAPADFEPEDQAHTSLGRMVHLPWSEQMTLQQAQKQAVAMYIADPGLAHIVLFDEQRQRVAAAWDRFIHPTHGPSLESILAIGEHIS